MSAFELISDLHKDARGFRPGAAYMEMFNEKPYAEQQGVWDALCEELAEREARDRQNELTAQRTYEVRIAGMMSDYSISRADAMRWIIEADEVDIAGALEQHGDASQEIEHFFYNQGIAFQLFPMYVAEITAIYNL